MRLEATVPESLGNAVVELCRELGLSRSQVIDEALALFLQAVLEVRQGRRLCSVDPRNEILACELMTPTLATLEWVLNPLSLKLSDKELQRMQELLEAPPTPTPHLQAAFSRQKKR